MILPPSILRIRLRRRKRRGLNLILPLILIWPIVLALALVLWPVALVVAAHYGKLRAAVRVLPRVFLVMCALRGLRIDLADAEERMLVYIL